MVSENDTSQPNNKALLANLQSFSRIPNSNSKRLGFPRKPASGKILTGRDDGPLSIDRFRREMARRSNSADFRFSGIAREETRLAKEQWLSELM